MPQPAEPEAVRAVSERLKPNPAPQVKQGALPPSYIAAAVTRTLVPLTRGETLNPRTFARTSCPPWGAPKGQILARSLLEAIFCHLLSFWDHWETALLGQILADGFVEANICNLRAPRPAIEFSFWDHWETAAFGQILARSHHIMVPKTGKRCIVGSFS